MSCSIEEAISFLNEKNIEAIDGGNILVIPFNYIEKCFSAEELVNFISMIKHHLQDIGYDKSWQINPYYLEKRGDEIDIHE